MFLFLCLCVFPFIWCQICLHVLLFLPHSNLLVYFVNFSVFLVSLCPIFLPSLPHTIVHNPYLTQPLKKINLIQTLPSFLINWVTWQLCFWVMDSFLLQILHLLERSKIFPEKSLKKLSMQILEYKWSWIENRGFGLLSIETSSRISQTDPAGLPLLAAGLCWDLADCYWEYVSTLCS